MDASGRVIEAAFIVLPGEAEAVFVTPGPSSPQND